MKEEETKRAATEEAYWMMHINNLDDCLSCPLSGCWADDDNDFTEKDCPIETSRERVTRKEKNRLQGIKYRKARIPILKKIEESVKAHGPLSVGETSHYAGVKKVTLWEWGRLGILKTIPMPKNDLGDKRSTYLIVGINWDHENQKH